jgi:predicted RNase H-like HicB family nuclease
MTEKEFTFIIEHDEDEGFVARCLELKGIYGQGKTEDEVINDIKQALDVALEYYKENEIEIPYRKYVQVKINVSSATSST